MKKILLIMSMVVSLVSGAFAGECDDDKYSYKNGHRAVFPQDTFSNNIAKNVSVCISSDVPSLWNEATKSAITLLNSEISTTNSILRYSYNSGSSCTINVNMSYDLPYEQYAKVSSFIGKLIPGKPELLINANRETVSSFTIMKSVMMHELLHAVGLFHTGHKVSYEIPNTDGYYDTKYAGRSIMCSTANETYPQRHFNFLDKRSLEILYPR